MSKYIFLKSGRKNAVISIKQLPRGGLAIGLSALDGPGVALPELVGVADLDTGPGVPGLSCCKQIK